MIVKLLRDARIKHKAGEIVTVTPEEAAFLLSVGSAIELIYEPKQPAKKKTVKK